MLGDLYLKVLVNGGSRVERVLARFCDLSSRDCLVYAHPFCFNFCTGTSRNANDANDQHEEGEDERFEIMRVLNNRDLYSWDGGMWSEAYYEREAHATCDLCLTLSCRHTYCKDRLSDFKFFSCLRPRTTHIGEKYALVRREQMFVVEDFFNN